MKKNGFTLVEVLAVLVIIGILSAISVAVYTNSINSSKNSLSEFQKNKLIEATRTYVAINTLSFNKIFSDADESFCVQISVEVLNKAGFLTADVIDPKDGNKLEGFIKVVYDTNTSQYKYDYAINPSCEYGYYVDSDGNIANGEV